MNSDVCKEFIISSPVLGHLFFKCWNFGLGWIFNMYGLGFGSES